MPFFAHDGAELHYTDGGSGQSRDTGHPDGPFSALQFAADTRALIEHLGLARVHAVGLSMGGAVAFQLAVDAPELLQSMTICNSAPAFIVRGVGGSLRGWLATGRAPTSHRSGRCSGGP